MSARRFLQNLHGSRLAYLGLDGLEVARLPSINKKWAHGESEAQPFASPATGLKRQPQEREHSDAEGDARDRLPPARGTKSLARGIVTGWPRPAIPLAGSLRRQ